MSSEDTSLQKSQNFVEHLDDSPKMAGAGLNAGVTSPNTWSTANHDTSQQQPRAAHCRSIPATHEGRSRAQAESSRSTRLSHMHPQFMYYVSTPLNTKNIFRTFQPPEAGLRDTLVLPSVQE